MQKHFVHHPVTDLRSGRLSGFVVIDFAVTDLVTDLVFDFVVSGLPFDLSLAQTIVL